VARSTKLRRDRTNACSAVNGGGSTGAEDDVNDDNKVDDDVEKAEKIEDVVLVRSCVGAGRTCGSSMSQPCGSKGRVRDDVAVLRAMYNNDPAIIAGSMSIVKIPSSDDSLSTSG
jgi:hypothetical protein